MKPWRRPRMSAPAPRSSWKPSSNSKRDPNLADLATQGHVREAELRLQREIEQVRAELKIDIAQ